MKRILVFGMSSKIGGTEKYILTLYQILDKVQIQFDFLFPYNIGKVDYEEEITKQGGRIYKEYYSLKEKKIPGCISIKQLFEKHPEWDGVYLNIQCIHTGYRLLEEAAKRNLSYRIMHIHSSNYMHKPSITEKLYENYFYFTKNKVLTKELACSHLAGTWIFRDNKFSVIPNAINFRDYCRKKTIRKKKREEYAINENDIVLGYCGQLREEKQPQKLLSIFYEFQKMKENSFLLVIGDGNLRKDIEKKAQELGIKERVIITGMTNYVSKYMQMIDVFLLPSKFEGFGIVLLEAQAVGVHCYTTKDTVPRETNITGRVHFIEANKSPKDWANQIILNGFDWKDCISILENSEYSLNALKEKMMKVFME